MQKIARSSQERVNNLPSSKFGTTKTIRLRTKALFVLLSLALLVAGLQGLLVTLSNNLATQTSVGSNQNAAQATQAISPNNDLQVKLPENKVEAANFVKQYGSPFNFSELSQLRRDYALKTGMTGVESDNFGLPNVNIANAKVANTNSSSVAPTPTAANDALFAKNSLSHSYIYTPTGCASIPSTSSYYEPNNTPALATNLLPSVTQLHDIRSVGSDPAPPNPTDGDIDWLRFKPSLGVSHTILIQFPSSSSGANPTIVAELWRGTATTADTLIDVYQTPGTRATPLTYVTQSSDTDPNVYFYVRIYGSLNTSCTGLYYVTLVNNVAAATPTSQADACRDQYEDDGQPSRAKELKVTYSATPPFSGTPGAPVTSTTNNEVQPHYICPVGDQDWVYVDLVKGKPYSIFTSGLSGGLDTMITIFEKDANGNLNPLYANDDFSGMDLSSRIDFVVPTTPSTATGEFVRYYVNIKDVSGHGSTNMKYTLTLTSSGTGKTTSNNCIDYYESDGVPAQAKEILLRETQNHVLCPDGDADWLKFFAKAGRTYQLVINFPDTIAGLDVYVYVFSILFDPADPNVVVSQRMIANSQAQASASEVRPRVSFTVPVDGVFYAQIKNNGDIGREGFNYTVGYFQGGAPVATTVAATATAVPTTIIAATATATATVTSTALSNETGQQNFADPAFQQLWSYNDLAVAQKQAERSWEWGPKPSVTMLEPYEDAPGGQRQVQYFDKSRMEINNPKGDRTSPWFVSNGLLVREMITGQLAKGDKSIEQRVPAGIPVAGDLTVENIAPSYARFGALITNGDSNRAANLSGQVVKSGLARDGSVWTLNTPPENIKVAAYVSETGHNLPQVFYDYMLSKGKIFDRGFRDGQLRDWVFAMGYPLSEPYWIKARVGGVEKDVLVQVFERRVLTYTPSNSAEWRIEMANVGQHYYLWRYGKNLND